MKIYACMDEWRGGWMKEGSPLHLPCAGSMHKAEACIVDQVHLTPHWGHVMWT